MKKLIVISSALIAFSAVNLFANDSNSINNGKGQAISASQYSLDTVPKKDTSKKKDSIAAQIIELR